MGRHMDTKQNMKSKSYSIVNFAIYRNDKIYNYLYNDGQRVAETDISSSPESAYYDKEGRVVCALQHAYERQKLLRSTGSLIIRQFFDSYATLCKDYKQAYKWC